MAVSKVCPECGALRDEASTCQDDLNQMLVWEQENPAERYAVHNIMVLCYYLQHSSLYSPDGLRYAKGLLVDFIENGVMPWQARRGNRNQVDSGKRDWKITARPGFVGAYLHPIQWKMTAADVVARGPVPYCDSVREWARSMLAELKASNNL